jgi:NodT family efflux transporter outer membrane factor (OMF) lipoprotein
MRPSIPSLPPVFLAIVLGTAGCNLAPHYARPSIDAPRQFRESPPPSADAAAGWGTARPNDADARGRWWELYGDPSLNALEEQVELSNQTIRAAEANFRAARAAVASARSALFPTITTTPSFTRTRTSQNLKAATGGTPAANTPALVNEYSLPIDASYEIDFWGRIRNGLAASRASAEASAADLATARLSTQAELAQDYFQVRAIDAEKQILDDTVASYRESLAETSALYRSGIDSEEDVARAQTQLNTAIAQATDFGVARAAYEHAIAVLIGKSPAGFALAVSPFTARPPSVPVGLPSNLLERRPDIAAAERRAAAANAEIGVARSAYFPKLLLGAAGGWQSSESSSWFDWPSRFWSLGPELAATLFDGGARRAQTEEARAAFDAAAANYRQTVLGAFQAVEDNLAALRVLDQEVKEQRTAVDSSRHLLDLANTRFKTGIDSYLNVITAQAALLSNRETEVQLQLRQMIASVSLVKAVGGGWTNTQLDVAASP